MQKNNKNNKNKQKIKTKKELENKPQRNEINVSRYVAAASLTLLIIIFSIISSNYINNKKIGIFQQQEENIKVDLLSLEVQDLLLENINCSFYDSNLFGDEMNELNSKLAYLEEQNGKNDPRVETLKKPYFLLELRHFALINKLNKNCNANISTILYFYSNEGDCELCDQQGFVLEYLAKKHDNLKVYNFDINTDLGILETIKKVYSLEHKTPILIINNKVHYGFKTSKEIEDLLYIGD